MTPIRREGVEGPPRWPARWLARTLGPGVVSESIQGDLYEEFLARQARSPRLARAWYWGAAFRLGMERGVVRAKSGIASVVTYMGEGSIAMLREMRLAVRGLMDRPLFTGVAVVSRGERDREEIDAFNGLARRHPLIALSITISMISLAGIPLTAGFMGKLYIFRDAIVGGYFYLALIGILTTLVSIYYYLRPIMAMYFHEEETPIRRVESPWGLHLTLFITSVATLLIGIFPNQLIELSERSIQSITG